MIRKFCDKCDIELNNTYWNNPKSESSHLISININQYRTFQILLCLKCFKEVESDIYKLLDWYVKLEEKERIRLGIK